MKKVIFTSIFLVIFSLIICESKVYNEVDIYKKINTNLCKLEENGLRLEYLSKKEISEILTIINNEFKVYNISFEEKKIENNEFYAFENFIENKKIKLVINKEDNAARVIIEIIDKKGLMDIEKVKNLLEKLEDDTIEDKRYFTYIKGKLNNDTEYKNNVNKLINTIGRIYIKDMATIPLNSGVTGTINLKNKERFNYSIMTYTTGTYLIIGSPVIFTTY